MKVPIMEESLADIKIRTNPAIRLKAVTVTFERLSDATIIQYTEKSLTASNQSDQDKPRNLIKRFCPVCNGAVPTEKGEKVTVKKSCQKCGTVLKYRCLKCKIEYEYYSSIFLHIQTKCGSVTPYSCSFCAYVTTRKDNLQTHVVRLHSNQDTSVNCKKCGAQFTNGYSLSSHLRYCGKTPNLVCSFCNFKTVYKCNFKNHLQLHSSEVSPSSSQTNKSVRTHKQYTHLVFRNCKYCNETIKPSAFYGNNICPTCKTKLSYECAKCGFESNIYSRIRYHIESKCGARESQCPRCDKMLPSIRKLQNHLQHCGMKFTCDLCQFKTTNKYKFNSHAKQHLNRTDQLSCQITKNKMYDEDNIANENNTPAADINTVDLGIVKVEKDASTSSCIDTSFETQFEAVSDFPTVKQETWIKEELMLSMSECSDYEGGDEFVSLKRKYRDFDDQLMPNASKKLKMEQNE